MVRSNGILTYLHALHALLYTTDEIHNSRVEEQKSYQSDYYGCRLINHTVPFASPLLHLKTGQHVTPRRRSSVKVLEKRSSSRTRLGGVSRDPSTAVTGIGNYRRARINTQPYGRDSHLRFNCKNLSRVNVVYRHSRQRVRHRCYAPHITSSPLAAVGCARFVPGILRLYHRVGLRSTVIAGARLAITYRASM